MKKVVAVVSLIDPATWSLLNDAELLELFCALAIAFALTSILPVDMTRSSPLPPSMPTTSAPAADFPVAEELPLVNVDLEPPLAVNSAVAEIDTRPWLNN